MNTLLLPNIHPSSLRRRKRRRQLSTVTSACSSKSKARNWYLIIKWNYSKASIWKWMKEKKQPAKELFKWDAISESALLNSNSFNQAERANLFRQILFIQTRFLRTAGSRTAAQAADKVRWSAYQFPQQLDERMSSFHNLRLHLSGLRVLPLRNRVHSLM